MPVIMFLILTGIFLSTVQYLTVPEHPTNKPFHYKNQFNETIITNKHSLKDAIKECLKKYKNDCYMDFSLSDLN